MHFLFFFVLETFTVAHADRGTIAFQNEAFANLNTGPTPTTVTATDTNGVVHTDSVVVSMQDTTTSNMWTGLETASVFAQTATGAGNNIRFVTKGSKAQSQNADD